MNISDFVFIAGPVCWCLYAIVNRGLTHREIVLGLRRPDEDEDDEPEDIETAARRLREAIETRTVTTLEIDVTDGWIDRLVAESVARVDLAAGYVLSDEARARVHALGTRAVEEALEEVRDDVDDWRSEKEGGS